MFENPAWLFVVWALGVGALALAVRYIHRRSDREDQRWREARARDARPRETPPSRFILPAFVVATAWVTFGWVGHIAGVAGEPAYSAEPGCIACCEPLDESGQQCQSDG